MSGLIGEHRVLLTGELDGIDDREGEAAQPMEVTTSPLGSVQDEQRVLERWLQSYLCGVPQLLRASFRKPDSEGDTSVFQPEDVTITPITALPVPPQLKERAFQRAAALFRVLTESVKVGQYCQVLILRGHVSISRLVNPDRLPSATSDAVVSAADLKQMSTVASKHPDSTGRSPSVPQDGAAPQPATISAASSAAAPSAAAASSAAHKDILSKKPPISAQAVPVAATAAPPGGAISSAKVTPVVHASSSSSSFAINAQAAAAAGSMPAVSRALLWVDHRVSGNARMKAAAQAEGVKVISLATGEEAKQWLLGPGRAYCAPGAKLRIITAHAVRPDDPLEVQHQRSVASPVLAALQLLKASDIPVLIYCNLSYGAAKEFVRQQQRPSLAATNEDEKALDFCCFR
jgi:hypothetical protein